MLAAQDTFGGFGPLIFFAFLFCFIVGYATTAQLQRILRERHPAVYDSLGRPTLFWNNSMKNSFMMLGVIRLCRFIRASIYSYWAFFVAVVVAGFVLAAR
jgi:hypothetical protein